MKVSRVRLATIGLITLSAATLFTVGAEIVAPNVQAHLPYIAILVLAWVICVPGLMRLPRLMRRPGPHDEDVTIDLSRRTLAVFIVILGIGLVPFDATLKASLAKPFGALVGLGMALVLASLFKQRKPGPIVDGRQTGA